MPKSNSSVVCSGTRNSSHRRFDNSFPLILPFNIDLLTANKTLNTVSDLPVNLTFKTSCGSKKYELLAVTYGSGGLFIAAIKMYKPIVKYDGWYLYDVIVEERKQGTGLQLTVGVPTPPTAYRMSYAIYLKRDQNDLLQTDLYGISYMTVLWTHTMDVKKNPKLTQNFLRVEFY